MHPVDAGQLNAMSNVACTSPRRPTGLIELIVRWGCGEIGDQIYPDAINVSCSTAASVTRAWAKQADCSTEVFDVGAVCAPLADWQCTATIVDNEPAGTIASRCVSRLAPRQVIEITWALPP